MVPPTCFDYALVQLSEFETASYNELFPYLYDWDLYKGVRDLWKKARLGDMPNVPEFTNCRAYGEGVCYQGQSYKREVMFLKMIIWCFATRDDGTDPNLKSLLTTLEVLWVDLGEQIDTTLLWKHEHGEQEWNLLASFLEGTIQQSKSLILDYYHCHLLSVSPLQGSRVNLSSDLEILQFLQLVLQNLEVLVQYKADVTTQTHPLKLRVNLSCDFFRLITTAHEHIDSEELRALQLRVVNFAKEAAVLAFLFWAKSANEQTTPLEAKINQLLSDMWHNIIKPYGSVGTPLYLGALKMIKLQLSDDGDTLLLYGGIVDRFVDLHFHKLVASALKDDLLIFTFLFTFMANPPQGRDQDEQLDLLCNQVDLLFRKYNYLTLSPGTFVEEDFTMDEKLLSDFGEKFEEALAKVKQLCVRIPGSRSFNFPRTNGLGFYDFLLQSLGRLNEKLHSNSAFIPYAKNFIIKIEQELVSMRPLVNDIFELQKKRKEMEDTWSQVIDLAYRIEHVINSCLAAIPSIWYNIACLSDFLDEIEDVKRKSLKVENYMTHCTQDLPLSLESFRTTPERKWSSTTNEEIIFHQEVTREIIDELIWGFKSLGTISIIGIGGLGKTTLAKTVLSSESVRHHFHKLAFCTVSQVHNTKKLLVEILCGVTSRKADQFVSMAEEDLADHLWKCLSGQKYLIVMDDIWGIKAWDEVKRSFPDNNNGSRIIFTTRERKAAMDAKSSLHDLHPLSVDESIKLLHLKVFGKDACPPIFSEVGKIIATNCKGLPLSVVVVAGLLKSDKTSPSWWEEIAKATCQFVGQECRDIIGLSYKYLPEQLKSCLLYMGIFEEDELIYSYKVRQLWIGEGFLNKSMNKSLRTVAKEHMSDLVEKNLVTDVTRTARGGIKWCRLHDLIHDFCRRQAKEDKFIWFKDDFTLPWHASSSSSNSTLGDWYRVSTKMDGRSFDDAKATILKNMHSLLCLDRVGKLEFVMENLRLVQVLHLEKAEEALFYHHLVHLRYLYIGASDMLWEVPESICNLWNLETFIFQCFLVNDKLPKTIWKMKMLRHLQIKRCELDVDEDDDEGGHQLLENLEFLSAVILRDETNARRVLQRVPNLQKFGFRLEDSHWEGKVVRINFFSKLESLQLSTEVPILAVTFPSTLKLLNFCYWGKESEDILPILSATSRLPDLEVLKWTGKFKNWNMKDDKFQKLKYLWMANQSLEQWNVSFDSFSCLESLDLIHCKKLEEIPACFKALSTLQKIRVMKCNDKLEASAIQIQEEHKEYGNEVRLIIDGNIVE